MHFAEIPKTRRIHRPTRATAAARESAKIVPLLTSPKKLGKMSLETGSYHPIGAWIAEPPSRVFIGRFLTCLTRDG
jgi:hypothetical protein